MLFIERSNRTERLLGRLAERLMTPSALPLVPRTIVVQGQGMERYIAQAVARDYGVLANASFLFPRKLLEQIFQLAEPQEPAAAGAQTERSPSEITKCWETDQLTWWVARRIAEQVEAPELAPLARHLDAEDRDWRLVQLAHEIARLFDDYITYRPDWVKRWAQKGPRSLASSASETLGADEAWQSWLFAGLVEDIGPGHLADRAADFSRKVAQGGGTDFSALEGALLNAFPHPLEVFAVSTLPPLYLGVLSDLAKVVDVRLSVLSPSRHYWADVWKEVKDAEAASPSSPAPFSVPSAGSAESLLAGLGRLGGDFQRALEDAPEIVESDADQFEVPDADGPLLARVQRSLLELDEDSGAALGPDDRSIQVHLCHGPKRELEVVKASVRNAFEADPTLRPEDVLIMAPQIDAWVPAIEAVFGVGKAEGDGMAYRIADRGTLRRSPVAEAFVGLLALLRGRGARSEVLDWLSLEPARAKLGLDAPGVVQLGEWAERAGVRFGFDAKHREGLGLPAEGEHAWAEAIDRGMLGHAVGFVPDLFAGRSAAPLGERADPELLGGLGELHGKLARARREVGASRTVASWSQWLAALLGDVLDQRDDNAHEHQMLRSTLDAVARAAASAGFLRPVPFEAMQERFVSALESNRPAQGFLSGGMTFCELVPLRAIPFRFVAIVGLSDLEFPRRRPSASYDLMARHPRAGDRNPRSDDRYLFLEALLSARDALVLTVPAKDLRDGADLPPSVVVSELLDVLDARFEPEAASAPQRTRDRIVFEHPLQSFSPAYFRPDSPLRWLALDEESFAGAVAQRATVGSVGESARRFFGGPLTSFPAPDARFSLDVLADRLLFSTRTFARDRLGLRLPRPEERVSDFDPTELAALEKSKLGSALLADLRSGSAPRMAAERMRSATTLPVGVRGDLEAEALAREVGDVARIAAERSEGKAGPREFFDFPFEWSVDWPQDVTAGWNLPEEMPLPQSLRLSGMLTNTSAEGRLDVSFSRVRSRREMQFWIEHLVLCVLVEDGIFERAGLEVAPESVLIGRPPSKKEAEGVVVFGAVPNARAELARLLAWAFSVDAAPLPFFPRTSLKFYDKMLKDQPEQAWRDAHQQLYGGDSQSQVPPEGADGFEFARVWEGLSPLAATSADGVVLGFEALSMTFFEGLFGARKVAPR